MSETFIENYLPLSDEDAYAWKPKIDAELWRVMADKTDDDLIPVYLWLKRIDSDVIMKALINEKGMDPAVYENEARFREEVLASIIKQLEEDLGKEAAHHKDENGMSPVDWVIHDKADEYLMAYRGIVRRAYSALNDSFVAENIDEKQRQIIINSRYSSMIVVEATKGEIETYAKHKVVEGISLYIAYIQEPDLNIALEQVHADSSTGTKSSYFNSGSGYKGAGVTVGILETAGGGNGGEYNSSAPQLSGIPNTQLTLLNEAGIGNSPVPTVVNNHATMVTSIIIGQAVGGYEGIAPAAKVYFTPVTDMADVIRGTQRLVDVGCKVINYSGGSDAGLIYSNHERAIDPLIADAKVTFVNSAGNTEGSGGTGNVTSPGKAFNVITVGNAMTKNHQTMVALAPPFNIFEQADIPPQPLPIPAIGSGYVHAAYLPNKPDIAAPGTVISCYGVPPLQTGTSIAAPIVTGVIAQMLQANPTVGMVPRVKTSLLVGAEASQITTRNNPLVGNYLRDKSGTGFLNAINAVKAAEANRWDYGSWNTVLRYTGTYYVSNAIWVSDGKTKLRLVMTFERISAGSVSSVFDLDDLDVYIKDSSGNTVALSTSSINNVEIIEYNIPPNSNPPALRYYSIYVDAYRLMSPGSYLNFGASWQLT